MFNSMKFDLKGILPYIVAGVIILAIVGGLFYYRSQHSYKPLTRYNFRGIEFQFRDDLRLAQSIPVYPDETSILNKVWDPGITKINMVYVPTAEPSNDNSMLSLGIIEIRYKLDRAYQEFNWVNEFTSTELNSYDNITSSNDTLTIVLVRPSLSDKTAIELDGNIAYIKGMTGKEFDLATIKFLMSALNITL